VKRFFLAFLLGGAVARAENPDRVFTLDRAVVTALQNNPALVSARHDVRSADLRVAEARAHFLPTLGVNMNATRFLAEDHAVLPSDFGSTVLNPVDEPDNFFSGRIYLRQTLYNGGRTRANVRLAEAARDQARVKGEEIEAAARASTTEVFYEVLWAEQALRLGEEARKDLERWARGVRGDTAAEALLESRAARLRREQAESRRRRDAAILEFRSVLGLELYTEVRCVGELSSSPLRVDLPKLLARAQDARLEIRGTEYQREMDRLSVNLSESERFPVIAFGAGYELGKTEFPLDRSYWNATLNVNLPIFDGFASRARIRQSRVAVQQNRVARAVVQDRVNRDVREAHATLLHWQSEMAERRADWDRLADLAGKAGDRGAVARADLRLEVLAAARAYWEAVHGHLVARARLEKAVGAPL
jgi:outer membrane protein